MQTIVLVIHIIIAIGLVGVVLIQRSEGGGLGMGGGGGGGGGMGGFMTGRAAADLLTRTTAILAAIFFTTSIILAIMANTSSHKGSILDQLQPSATTQQKSDAPTAPISE